MIAQAKPAPAPSCEECGAPVWVVNKHVVCSRYWNHNPQPEKRHKRIGPRLVSDSIPRIETRKGPTISRALPAKHRAWFKQNLDTEQYVTEEGGTTTTYTRLLVRPAHH